MHALKEHDEVRATHVLHPEEERSEAHADENGARGVGHKGNHSRTHHHKGLDQKETRWGKAWGKINKLEHCQKCLKHVLAATMAELG